MVKIALDAGHGYNTPGKRTPDGEREWSFNNKVLLAATERLNMYQNVQILRLDDPTGRTDIPLSTRTARANNWGADVLVSIHHNALAGKWHSGGGVETFTQPGSSRASEQIAAIINPRIVSAMGLRNRGTKKMNLHMTRVSRMPAILTEGGFMDSTVDIVAMRDDNKLKAQGYAIADGLAQYFKMKLKSGATSTSSPSSPPTPNYLKYGDRGDTVKLYQDKLTRAGYPLVLDGSFGPAMQAAVRKFQSDYNLVVDGYLGSATQKKLDEVLISMRNKPSTPVRPSTPTIEGGDELYKPSADAIINSTAVVMRRLEQKSEKPLDPQWRKKLLAGELTVSDAIGIIFVAMERGHIVGK